MLQFFTLLEGWWDGNGGKGLWAELSFNWYYPLCIDTGKWDFALTYGWTNVTLKHTHEHATYLCQLKGKSVFTQTWMLIDAQNNKREPPTNTHPNSDTLTQCHTSIVSYFELSAPWKIKIVSHIPTCRADIPLLKPVFSTFNPNQVCLFTFFFSSFSTSNKAESLYKPPRDREIHLKKIITDKHNLPLSRFNLFMPSNLFLRPRKPWYEPLSFPQCTATKTCNTHAKTAFPPCAAKPRGSSIHI